MIDNPHKVCSGCGRPIMRCAECNKEFYPERKDAQTCSTLCRVHRFRRLERMRRKEEATAS